MTNNTVQMPKDKKAIIIGSGIGGITTSIFLAQQGYEVEIFEKNGSVGGRCGNFIRDGHRFDIGATLLMMTDIYEKTYQAIGRKLEDELELFRMDPVYKINFQPGGELHFSSDLAKLQKQFETIEPGSYRKFLEYMSESYSSYKLSMKHIINRNYYKASDFFNLKNMLLLFKLKAFKGHYKYTGRFFKSELLRIAFTFQNIYVGQNPFSASALFSMLPFLELTDGVWFPKGGMYSIIENLVDIAKEHNVKIHLNSTVEKIIVEKNKAIGIAIKNGETHTADIIISNADLPYVYNELLPACRMVPRINRMNYTCSAFVFHWGIDKVYGSLEQHNVYVSKNFKANVNTLFKQKTLSDEPSFYLHSPVKTDKTAAPEAHDSITVIVPVGNTDSKIKPNWNELKIKAREAVFKRLEDDGLADFRNHIKFETCYTPQTWSTLFNLTHGATFGSLSHNLLQMGYMRPHNQHGKYKNLFFTGGSTHPGNGLPMVLLSAKLTSEKINTYFSANKN